MNQVDPAGIDTPIGYVDLGRVRANAKRVADYAAQHGLAWRPHLKTHKSLEVARIQLDAGARGLPDVAQLDRQDGVADRRVEARGRLGQLAAVVRA